MEEAILLFKEHGQLILFAVGFLEFIGAPFAGVPVLVAAGGVAAAQGLSFPGMVLATALGGLMADGTWYTLARLRGHGIVHWVCGLSSNPRACALSVERKVATVGPLFLLPAKFVPGAGNMVAAASGFTGIPAGTFLALDFVGLLAWASAYMGVGWVFSAQVEVAVEWGSRITIWLLAGAVFLVVAALVWKILKIRMHRMAHQE